METEKTPTERLQLAEERIDWVLSHPGISDWLKHALRMARSQHPVAILNDLALLETLLQHRSRALIDRLLSEPGSKHAAPASRDLPSG